MGVSASRASVSGCDGVSLADRVAARQARFKAAQAVEGQGPTPASAPRPAAEPARREPLEGQLELFPTAEAAGEPGGVATIPAAALADRRLADVDFAVIAVLSVAAGPDRRCVATDAELSARTSGRPGPKAMGAVLSRLEALGYIRVEAGPVGRVVALTWG